MSALIKSLKFMGNRRYLYLAAIVIMAVLKSMLDVITSFFVNNLYIGISNSDRNFILVLSFKCILLGGILIIIWRFFTIVYNNEAKRVTAKIQKKVYTKAMRLPLGYYEQKSQGDFLSKLSYNINKASDVYGSRFRRVVTPFISVIVYLFSMLHLNWKMTSLLLGADIILLLLNLGINKPMKSLSEKVITIKTKETGILINIINGIEIIKIYTLENIFKNRFEQAITKCKKEQNKRNLLLAILESFQSGFDLLCSVLFVGIGIAMIKTSNIALGELVAIFVLYESFNYHFLQIGKYIPELVECLVYMNDLFIFLELEEEHEHSISGEPEKILNSNAVSIRNVTFQYPGVPKNIIENLSLDFPSGKMTAVTGKTGCGKSTLLKLILGFYNTYGSIYVCGEKIERLGFEKLRNLISYVPQEPYLYNVSIEENISYGKPSASKEEIVKAAKAANAHDFILKQPDGYQTIITKGGGNLSGGERQRISIARAILKNAPIILLDEATSALDNEAEMSINKFLMQNSEKTIIVVAHRPTTIDKAENIVNL